MANKPITVKGINPKRVNTTSLNVNKHQKKKKPILKKMVSSSTPDTPSIAKVAPASLAEPVAQETSWPVLSDKAFPGWIGAFVRLACEYSEADPVAVLVTLLLRIAAEVYGVYFNIGDDKQMARTNAVLVGDSAKARKGTSAKPVMRLFRGLKNSARVTPGPLTSGPGLVYHVRDATKEFDKKTGLYIVTDEGVADKRLFVLEEEFETTLSCVRRGGNYLSATVRCFFDDGTSEPLTKTSKIKATKAHVVILAHITREELTAVMNKVQMTNGFGNRFLWILVRRQKPIAMPKAMPASEVEAFRKILAKNIEAAKKLGALTMTSTAAKLWDDSYPELTMDFSGTAGAMSNRSETHTIRVAEIYAIARGHEKIQSTDLEAAIEVVKYSRVSTSIIFQGCPDDSQKVKILQALRDADNNELSLTEINVDVFKRNISSEDIRKMLSELESAKLAVITVTKDSETGRNKTMVTLASVGAVKPD